MGHTLAGPDHNFNPGRDLAHDRRTPQGSDMDALDLVQRCWNGLVARRGSLPSTAATVLEEMVRAYREPHRHYHTLDHVAALLTLLDRYGAEVADSDAVTAAILFHDVVYDPTRPDNEEASAAWAAARLARLGFAEDLRDKVARYILATQHDRCVDPAGEADLALLLDLDLSVLAAPPRRLSHLCRGHPKRVRVRPRPALSCGAAAPAGDVSAARADLSH
jgi:predicted metal-dependent HD superfamily phosphohydrolase